MNDLTLYNRYRPLIGTGDQISWTGNGLVSRLIRLYSHRSHVATVVQSPRHPDFWRRIVQMEAWEGEVNPRYLSHRLAEYDGMAYWHPLRPELKRYREDIDAFLWKLIGTKYDFKGLFKNALGLVKADTRKMFCSELSGFALTECIPRRILERYLPHPDLEDLLQGKALRPGGIAKLPIYLPEEQLLFDKGIAFAKPTSLYPLSG